MAVATGAAAESQVQVSYYSSHLDGFGPKMPSILNRMLSKSALLQTQIPSLDNYKQVMHYCQTSAESVKEALIDGGMKFSMH